MNHLRAKNLVNSVCLVTGLIILNCSIGGPETYLNQKGNLREQNIVDSLIELIVEQFLNFENSISENQNHNLENTKNISLKEVIDFSYFPFAERFIFQSHNVYQIKFEIYNETYNAQFHPELTPPPPKA